MNSFLASQPKIASLVEPMLATTDARSFISHHLGEEIMDRLHGEKLPIIGGDDLTKERRVGASMIAMSRDSMKGFLFCQAVVLKKHVPWRKASPFSSKCSPKGFPFCLVVVLFDCISLSSLRLLLS
ncbi:hypothetical protein BT93_H1058 [Corymbia citriodora subsp. variegata]|nr:hypothetical protein BT93_H1058 [Corymbia citriodora subsp. variegata]